MNAPLANDLRIAARVLDAMRTAGIDPETDEDAADLLSSECELPARLLRMIRVARREEAEAKGIDGLLDDLMARQARRNTKAQKLRDIVRDAMSELGLTKLPAADVTVSLSAGKPPLVITDQVALPCEMFRTTITPDKTAIRAALASGREVPGALLGNPIPTLTIRGR